MKLKIIIIGIIALNPLNVSSQIAKWVLPLEYDEMPERQDDILIGKKNGKDIYHDWKNGRERDGIQGQRHPANDGTIVVTAQGTDDLVGIIKTSGESVKKEGYKVPWSYFKMEDGCLLTKKDDKYYFLQLLPDKSDLYALDPPMEEAYPMNNGVALCKIKMKKKNYWTLLQVGTNQLVPLSMKLNGKNVDYEDFDDSNYNSNFLSSVNDEGIALVIYKKRVYLLDVNNPSHELKPLFEDETDSNPKNQVVVGDVINKKQNQEFEYVIKANNGKSDKNSSVHLVFDKFYALQKYVFNSTSNYKEYKKDQTPEKSFNSALEITETNGEYGVKLKNGKELLPPQFEKVITTDDNRAYVKNHGKWGLLEFDPSKEFMIKLVDNEEKEIVFKRKTLTSKLRLHFPSELKPDKGFTYDVISGGLKLLKTEDYDCIETPNGNYVQYRCVFDIPDQEMENEYQEYSYNFQITYNQGLLSPVIPFMVNAKFDKPKVNILNEKLDIKEGRYFFNFQIENDEERGNPDFKPYLKFDNDTVRMDYEFVKINDLNWACYFNSLAYGTYNFDLYVGEEGCPPSITTLVLEYEKPIQKQEKPTPRIKHVKIHGPTPPPPPPPKDDIKDIHIKV